MAVRKVVQIDEAKCNGCGECIPNCLEGALQIIDGKARLVSDAYCDGLGACLGACPQGAITVTEREAEQFDQEAVDAHRARQTAPGRNAEPAACPAAALASAFGHADQGPAEQQEDAATALSHWPVQLMLVAVQAPFLDGADLLLAADCVPFAAPDFHRRLLRGRKVLVGCPKLDDYTYYTDKLAAILQHNDVRSLTVAHMEVPCCYGLMGLARRALAQSGKQMEIREIVVTTRGAITEADSSQERTVPVARKT